MVGAATLLGGPITGFLLIQRNFVELRQYGKAQKIWVLGGGAILAYYGLLLWVTYAYYGLEQIEYTKLIPPLLLEAVIIFQQRDRLKEFFQGGATRRSLFGIANYVLYGIAVEALLFALCWNLMPNMRGEKVEIGRNRHELYYGGMDPGEAKGLAGELEFADYLVGRDRRFLRAAKEGDGYRLFFPVKRRMAGDLEHLAHYSLLLGDLETRTGKPFRGCFLDNTYALEDTSCFGRDAVALLQPMRKELSTSKEVLARVGAETDFFIAFFKEADAKSKKWVVYERVPTLYIFVGNGITGYSHEALPEKVIRSYGSREKAELGLRILANCFRGVEWRKGDNLYLQYIEALESIKANLASMAEPEEIIIERGP